MPPGPADHHPADVPRPWPLFPLSNLPGWLHVATILNPMTYAVEPIRSTVFDHLDLSSAARTTFDPGITWGGYGPGAAPGGDRGRHLPGPARPGRSPFRPDRVATVTAGSGEHVRGRRQSPQLQPQPQVGLDAGQHPDKPAGSVCRGGNRDPHRTSWEGLDGEGGEQAKEAAGLTRRMARSTVWAGMLATVVMVGRKTAGGARTSDGQGDRGRRVGRLAGTRRGRRRRPLGRPPDRPAGGCYRRPAAGGPTPPRRSRPRAGRTSPSEPQGGQGRPGPTAGRGRGLLRSAGPVPGHHRRRLHLHGLVADPQTVRDQINQLTTMLSPETAKLAGTQLEQVTSSAGGALGWPPSSAS